ncbi:hypothetical protein Z949_3443 [Sulfitobacter guttiformis KCTC 32187]|nr:hypothetical protein Z949_3443 [Sulfitobacter guttiformis KCTC 32187]
MFCVASRRSHKVVRGIIAASKTGLMEPEMNFGVLTLCSTRHWLSIRPSDAIKNAVATI